MSDFEHLFMSDFHMYVSLEKCLLKSLAHFLSGLLIFLEFSCRCCLYIFEIMSLSVSSFAIIFSLSEGSFYLVYIFLCCTETFKVNSILYAHFCFYFQYSWRLGIVDPAMIYVMEFFAYVLF